MPCYCPIDAWPPANPAADRRPVFSPGLSYKGARPFMLPCGRCNGCLDDKARDWGLRCAHEVQHWTSRGRGSSFIRLSYASEHLPAGGTLVAGDLVRFVRRVKAWLRDQPENQAGELWRISYLGCGEYGDRGHRPHYHVALFGCDFSQDRYAWAKSGSGAVLYRSPTLERLWPFGHSTLGEVNAKSGAYMARYTFKGAKRDPAQYRRVDPATGEVYEVAPQFLRMSLKPAIGFRWYEQFKADCFSDFLVIDGKKVPVPRYYRRRLAAEDPELWRQMTARRVARMQQHREDQTDSRLLVRMEAKALRQARLAREVDDAE
jgi:hypothetical protein